MFFVSHKVPVPISVIQVYSLSLTIGSMLPETVSYTAWLRCTIPSPKPTLVLKSFANPSLHSNWKLITCYSSPINPSPYLPQTPTHPPSHMPNFYLLITLPICSEFVSVLFFNVFLMKYLYPFRTERNCDKNTTADIKVSSPIHYPAPIIYYSKEVKGQRKCFDNFCKYVFTCVNIILEVHDFFSSG